MLTKFSMPRNPTKGNPNRRILLSDDPEDAQRLYNYNIRDIEAEAELSGLIPDLTEDELKFWQCDQDINHRGVRLDIESIRACISIVEQAHKKYNDRLKIITQGSVSRASEVAKIRKWLESRGVHTETLDSESVAILLRDAKIIPEIVEVLQIRDLISSAAVKKLYAMINQVCQSGRVHDLFIYHSARTGRAAGSGPQPQNLPNSGPDVFLCKRCTFYSCTSGYCSCCGGALDSDIAMEWNPKAVEQALETIRTGSLEAVEFYHGNAIGTISACLRGLFIPDPGKDFICSDFSAIEAVVLAALAGEEWRMEVFRTHGKIYEMSASKITGIPFEEFIKHKQQTGQHHPKRKTVGKVSELASGYGGWIGAWKAFGADAFFSEQEIKQAIIAWRDASPAIVEFWGGQVKGWIPHMYGLEGAAIQAVLYPGQEFECRGFVWVCHRDILYCRLLSGRHLTYHRPRLRPSDRKVGTYSLSFEGWNSNPKYGPPGWVRMDTYSGKLTENCVQAVARDILAHAIVNLERSGYPIVLHVHDEIVSEIPENFGSIEEFEVIMSTMPHWGERLAY